MKHVLDEKDAAYPIRPSDIDASTHFWDAFGNSETEVSANYIVAFCQERVGWFPFTFKQLNRFYLANKPEGHEDYTFNGLRHAQPGTLEWLQDEENQFVQFGKDGKFRVTHEFVARCFLSSPNFDARA